MPRVRRTDRLRTYVIHYSGTGIVPGDAEFCFTEPHEVCEDSTQSFKAVGYVLGGKTLLNGLNQVPAATAFDPDGQQIPQRYWEFLPNNSNDSPRYSAADVNAQLEQAIVSNHEKLADRQIVVPLSGGYDSRAILLALVKLGYKNILTFTFGRPSSPEVTLSRSIAERLGLAWHCVTYTKSTWRRLKHDAPFNRYLHFCSKGISVPNVQVYPALEQLVKQGIITPDAIVLPGHTGDFVSGGHIPESLMYPYEHTEQLNHLGQVIVKKHFKFDRELRRSGAVPDYLMAQLEERFAQYAGKGYPLATMFEAWECSERQAKFIVNSNRYYEFFNLDWFMPLWEDNFVDFWVDVPYPQRRNKALWTEAVEALWQQVTGEITPLGDAEAHLTPWQLQWKHRLDYFFDNNHLLQLVPFSRWLKYKLQLSNKNGSLYGYLADVMLERYRSGRPEEPIWPD